MKVLVDEAAVANLSRSFSIIPQFYSVIIDPVSKEVISGIHRKEAAKTGTLVKEYVLPDGFIEGLAKKPGVTREMMVVIIRQHLNIQRQVKEDETRSELLDLAKGFEAMGIRKELIALHVVKVSGLSESRTLALLPNEYKQRAKVKAGRVSALAQEQKRAETPQKVEEISQLGTEYSKEIEQRPELRVRTLASPQNEPAEGKAETCGDCGEALRFYGCGFLHCTNPNCGNVSAHPVKRKSQ